MMRRAVGSSSHGSASAVASCVAEWARKQKQSSIPNSSSSNRNSNTSSSSHTSSGIAVSSSLPASLLGHYSSTSHNSHGAFTFTSAMTVAHSNPYATGTSRRFIVVETNETPNPECLRFFSMELSFLAPGQTMDFPNEGHSYKSPLAQILFAIDGVKAVYFADEYITVTKDETADWGVVAEMVKEAITSFAEGNESILSDEGHELMPNNNQDTEPQPHDSEVVLAIKELLASRIRPMVQGDGGNVRYIGFEEDEGLVYVMMEGACKACPSSGMTLKNGIERMLMHWVPEVTEVQEVDEDFALDYARQEKEALEKQKEQSSSNSNSEDAKSSENTSSSTEKKEEVK